MVLIILCLLIQFNSRVELPDKIEILPKSASVEIGETLQFSATAYDTNNKVISGLIPRWHIAESAIATVDESGIIEAHSTGTAVLVVVLGGMPEYAE